MLEFKDLKNMKDIAEFLEVDIELLKNVLFAKRNYFSFSIPKRDGSFRIINAPKKNLNDIQKKY